MEQLRNMLGFPDLGVNLPPPDGLKKYPSISSSFIITAGVVWMLTSAAVFKVRGMSNRYLLIGYALMSIAFVSFKATVVACLLNDEESVKSFMWEWVNFAFMRSAYRTGFKEMEIKLSCCGLRGPETYFGNPPPTCCPKTDDNRPCTIDNAFAIGCPDALFDRFIEVGHQEIKIGVAFIAVQMVAIYFLMCWIVKQEIATTNPANQQADR